MNEPTIHGIHGVTEMQWFNNYYYTLQSRYTWMLKQLSLQGHLWYPTFHFSLYYLQQFQLN